MPRFSDFIVWHGKLSFFHMSFLENGAHINQIISQVSVPKISSILRKIKFGLKYHIRPSRTKDIPKIRLTSTFNIYALHENQFYIINT